MDETQPTPAWWAKIPEPVRQYGLKLALWALTVAAAALAVRYGLAPPPLPAVVELPPEKVAPAIAEALAVPHADPPEPLRFCGFRATLAERLAAGPWPVKRLPWSIDTTQYSGVLTRAQIVEAIDVAFRAWARDLDFDPAHVESEAGALVRMRFATIDGQLNILAQSELADGTARPKQQEYDRAESWTVSSNPTSATIDLVRVAAHEIGHVLGLEHDAENSGALMAPIYSRTVRFPTERDIGRAVSLGYKRRVTTGPSPSPAAPPIQLSVTADPEKLAEALRKAGYKVELIGR